MSAASLGDIGGRFDGDPHVGRVERDRVVDPVAEERDVAIRGPMGPDQSRLLLGADPGEDRRVANAGPEGLVVELVDFGASQDASNLQTEVTADLLGDERVVAGHDLDEDPEVREALERRRRIGFRPIEEDEVAGENKIVLVRHGRGLEGRRDSGRDGDSAAPGMELALQRFASRVAHVAAGSKDALGCTLGDQDPSVGGVIDEHGCHPPIVIEGHHRQPRRRLGRDRPGFGGLEEGNVKRVAGHDGSVLDRRFVADEPELEHIGRWGTNRVDRAFEADATFGERAGLVGEEDLDVAKILDAHQPLDQDLLACESTRARGQARGDHRG